MIESGLGMGGGNSLLQANLDAGNASTEASKSDADLAGDSTEKASEAGDILGLLLYGKFEEWAAAKLETENEWLRDLRSFNGIYEGEEEAKYESEVFFHITRTKTKSAYARIVDLLFQAGDKHWSVTSGVVVELPPFKKKAIVDEIISMLDQIPTSEEVDVIAKTVAEVAAEKMSNEIEDQLNEAGYENEAKIAYLEMCIVGTGCLKGVITKVKASKNWEENNGEWSLSNKTKKIPDVNAVSVFDVYPDPYAIFKEDMEGCFQRHVLTRKQFRELGDLPGFDKEAIDEVVRTYENGNHTPRNHETELRSMAGYSSTDSNSGKYEVLEYWGSVTGRELEAAGVKGVTQENVYDDFNTNVWHCGNRTIMAVINKSTPADNPFNFIPYERDLYSLWGIGPPRSMRDSQSVMNAAIQALLTNMAYSSGPQGECNVSLLADGEDPKDQKPHKIWERDGGDPTTPLFRWFNVPDNTGPLSAIIEMFRKFADEETMMPSYTHGESSPGLTKTSSGISMMMGAANINIKPVIKNIDDYGTTPVITGVYNWNMQYSPKKDIKGDLVVLARGSTALVAKEIRSQKLLNFYNITAENPRINSEYILTEIAKSLDIDATEAIFTDDQIAANNPGGPGNPGGNVEPGMENGGEVLPPAAI